MEHKDMTFSRTIRFVLAAALAFSFLAPGSAKYKTEKKTDDEFTIVWSDPIHVTAGGSHELKVVDTVNEGWYAFVIWGACGSPGRNASGQSGVAAAVADNYGRGGCVKGLVYLEDGTYYIKAGALPGAWAANGTSGAAQYGGAPGGGNGYVSGNWFYEGGGGGGFSGIFKGGGLPSDMSAQAVAVAGGGGGGATEYWSGSHYFYGYIRDTNGSLYGLYGFPIDGMNGIGGDGGGYASYGISATGIANTEVQNTTGGGAGGNGVNWNGYLLSGGAGGGTNHSPSPLTGGSDERNGGGVVNYAYYNATYNQFDRRWILMSYAYAGAENTGDGQGGSAIPSSANDYFCLCAGGGGGGFEGGGGGGFTQYSAYGGPAANYYNASAGGGGGGSSYITATNAYAWAGNTNAFSGRGLNSQIADYLNSTQFQTFPSGRYGGSVDVLYLGPDNPTSRAFMVNWY